MDSSDAIRHIRSFNRFYTNVLSLLDQSVLRSGYSLAEARVLYEIKELAPCSARSIMDNLNIDEGYLSRILNQFVARELVLKKQSPEDKRQYLLKLTARGRRECEMLDLLANQSVGGMIDHLSEDETSSLLSQMNQITELLRHEKATEH